MPEFAENGLSLSWAASQANDGALAGARRMLVRVTPAHPSNVVRGLCSMGSGPEQEVRGFPLGLDPASGAQVFALDLPDPPPGRSLTWRPVASCSGRTADPRRGGLSPDILRGAEPTPPAPSVAAVIAQEGVPAPAARFAFSPEFLFRVTAPLEPDEHPVGETPDGLRTMFALRRGGYLDGPALSGEVLHGGGDWLRIRPDGIGVCQIHALIKPVGGGVVLTEYSGLVDFGPDGYRAIARGQGPKRAPLRLAPRYLTAEPRLQWLNRVQGFAIGEVNLEALVVEYDLYAVRSPAP